MPISVPALLDSAQTFATAADSSDAALDLLQIVDASRAYTSGYTRRNYYDSAGLLPAADSSLEGMISLVKAGDPYTGSGNGLYLCTGTEWTEFYDLDSGTAPPIQGETSGYVSGGLEGPTVPATTVNKIEKFPFSSDANATDVGDLTVGRYQTAGQSSSTHGYNSGGVAPPLSPPTQNIIDKFPFSSNGNASDVGDLTVKRQTAAGQHSENNGYSSGGYDGSVSPALSNVIDKFPFSTDGNATDVGDLTVTRWGVAGQSSGTNGYTSGGSTPSASNVIDKFPFSSDGNATDVGDLTVARKNTAGHSSDASGYNAGGDVPGAGTNVIEKFPFASDGNATDVGDLTLAREKPSGQSSTVSGYSSGGFIGPANPQRTNVIDKFPFSSDANATDVGDLTAERADTAGQQV